MIDLARYTHLRALLECESHQEHASLLRELRRLEHEALREGLLYMHDGQGDYRLIRLPLHKWMTYLHLFEEHDHARVRMAEAEIITLLLEIEEFAHMQDILITLV